MVCTKQAYSVATGWSAAQLASAFRSAFIDAGLMTDWFDSFLNNSYETRVLKIEYDNTKTYGAVYYWFMFGGVNAPGFFFNVATGWNAVTKVPTGTQYLDYLSNATNTYVNHRQLLSLTTGSALELIRYTSGVDPNQSWFCLKQGSTRLAFSLLKGGTQVQDWLDLNKGYVSGFHYAVPNTSNGAGLIHFANGPILRRELVKGPALTNSTSTNIFLNSSTNQRSIGYAGAGQATSSQELNFSLNNPWIFLPVGFSAYNPAYTANSVPVFHSMPITSYFKHALPSDIGFTFYYATNIFLTGDTLVVTAGTEEWEVLDFSANANAVTGASPLFLARVV